MTDFLGAWHFDLFVAANIALAAALYLMTIARVNARAGTGKSAVMHGRWPAWTTACYLTGLALIAAMYLGPMAAWSHTFFWVHMTQHLVITMAAAPLLVLGAPITLALRACNDRNRRAMTRMLRTRAVRVATDPILTWLLFAGMLLAVHFTPFYDWALSNHGAMAIIEQPGFLIVSLLYYLPLIGSNLLPRRPSHGQRLLSLGLMMLPEALIGAVIYFSPVVLYDGYDTTRPFGLDALTDQQMSGAMMWALVMVVDSFWMMWVAADWFASEERRSSKVDAEIASHSPSP